VRSSRLRPAKSVVRTFVGRDSTRVRCCGEAIRTAAETEFEAEDRSSEERLGKGVVAASAFFAHCLVCLDEIATEATDACGLALGLQNRFTFLVGTVFFTIFEKLSK
jgi:hypothetical protein